MKTGFEDQPQIAKKAGNHYKSPCVWVITGAECRLYSFSQAQVSKPWSIHSSVHSVERRFCPAAGKHRIQYDNAPDHREHSDPEPEVLLFETSPFGTLDAIVQHDGKVVYFYLNESQQGRSPGQQNSFGTRACWVCNLELGPYVLNEDEMRQGIAPMMPRTHTLHREGQPVPDPDRLQVVWLEEGNGAALLESIPNSDKNKTLAVIPPWSGLEGFHGYSAQCAMESPLCWPMPENPRLEQRIAKAKEFWEQFESPPDPFSVLQPQILSAYDTRFLPARGDGHSTSNQRSGLPKQQYYAIDGGSFPPRGMVSYQFPDELILATVGLSLCPQPAVELYTDDPINHRRIELAIRLTGDFGDGPDTPEIENLRQQLSGLAGYPWSHFTWLGNGHTCGLVGANPDCEAALLIHDSIVSSLRTEQVYRNSAPLPDFRGDPINLLWLIPITAAERQGLQDSNLTVNEIVTNMP